MGWGRWISLGVPERKTELSDQRTEIDRLRKEVRARPEVPASIEARLQFLHRENDELKLYLAAVLRLLVAKNVATPEEIRSLIEAVDQEDGVKDGRFGGPIVPHV